MPAPSLGETRRPEPPKEVQASFWIWVAGAVLSLVNVAYLFINKDDAVAAAVREYQKNPRGDVTVDQVRDTANTAIIVIAVLALLLSLLFAFLALKEREGRNWARVTLTVLAVIAVLTQLGSSNPVSIISALFAIVATVLMYLPNANTYFSTMKRIG